jgi:hypothetical protein
MQALTAVCVCKGYELRKFNSYNAAASLVLRLMSGLSRNWQENIPRNKMLLIRDYTHVTLNGMYHSILVWLFCAFFAGIEGRTIGILLSGGNVVSGSVFRLSTKFNMKLNVAYYFEIICFTNLILLILWIWHLHDVRNLWQEWLLLFPYFLGYALFKKLRY